MANAFDFELKADEQVSAAIQRIEDAVKTLDPLLEKATDNLKLGGQDSLDGLESLSDRLAKMSTFARDNVQFIGDMVPPLKMVGELGGKLGGALKFGAAGVAAYGLGKGVAYMAGKLQDASHSAYELDVASKNAGMRADDFSRLSGAMQILGISAESANQSTEGLFYTFNDALQGRNNGTLAALQQIGVQIVQNKNGTADVLATMQRLAHVLPTLTSEKQKTVTDAIGLDANGLALLREGMRLKELLAKSDKFGLTVDPKLNGQLTEINGTINELSASYEGFKNRVQNKMLGWLLSDGSVKDSLEGVTDVFSNGLDSISLSHVVGFNRGKEADQLRWGYNNSEFYDTLSAGDKIGLDFGYMTDGYREKYNAWQKPIDAVNQLERDLTLATAPSSAHMINSPDQVMGNTQEQQRLSQLEKQYNLPPNLLDKVWSTESARGKNMLSSAGAEGHFQFMPPTGRAYGLKTREDRMDFTKSSEAAARYLSDLLKMFDGDVRKAVAAYNWGPERVKNLGLGYAPAETRNYLQQIMPGLPLFQPQNGVYGDGNSTVSSREQDTDRPSILAPASIQQEDISRVSEAMSKAISENKFQLEVTLVNSQTGERHKVQADGGGRVSLSMQSLS
ncbi:MULTISPECIES: transglycosylase SLT domain-containing protein [unclassified Serratia (in: enterobacteria)]|uniref:transglycosylase SLT domain-containing protein n=1 Tax=unclassified Serratia (in: enterobacteria) TaxID=2647522 RepID=UPI000505FA38|nr:MULTISPECIES: transglycosylase SLT domain-containing protein [unclassified Serratia (in: enterobacteria)]KFK94594.1 lytic transglycosylase [Serratia sp. Ag2]KFK95814.1 lytic transglycosylase [Serratia sp. Ag1]